MTDAEKAYAAIKDQIVTLKMAPGSSISLVDLATELGLGRTPVREALKQLQAENLVVVVQRRGMSVAEIALTDLRQLYEVRVLLEPACARLAAERMTEAQIEEAHRLLEAIRGTTTDDIMQRYVYERKIHELIARSCGNKHLEYLNRHYYELSLRIWYLVLNWLPPEAIDTDRHSALIDAIVRHDGAQAEECMRQHVTFFYETTKTTL